LTKDEEKVHIKWQNTKKQKRRVFGIRKAMQLSKAIGFC